jgi:UDP-N-acetylglucosamine 3-dehydrogenase
MSRLRVGVVGAGGSASVIHLPGYAANHDVQIVAIASLDHDASRRQAEKYSIPKVFESVDQLIGDPDVQAISVCTPPATHEPIATQAVRAGKHVLIEKPVSTSLAALHRIKTLAREAAVVVDLVHNERFMDFNLKAKDVIKQGGLGEIQAIIQFIGTTGPESWTANAGWFRDPKTSGGGVLMDLAVHKIDLAGWLLERPILQGAHAQFEGPVEDAASIHLVAEGPVWLTVTASWRGPADEATLLVVGTEAILEGSWTVGRLQLRKGHDTTEISTEIPWTEADTSPQGMIAAFVEACITGRKPVDTDLTWDSGTRCVLEAYEARSPR